MYLKIKPLSVNQAWKGRRFRTDKYIDYRKHILSLMPPMSVPEGRLSVSITFGFSSLASDIDNPLKPFLDCLQNRYGFNDKMIKFLFVESVKVKKGEEFIVCHIQKAPKQRLSLIRLVRALIYKANRAMRD